MTRYYFSFAEPNIVGVFIVRFLNELICYNPVNTQKAGESDVYDAGNDNVRLAGANR